MTNLENIFSLPANQQGDPPFSSAETAAGLEKGGILLCKNRRIPSPPPRDSRERCARPAGRRLPALAAARRKVYVFSGSASVGLGTGCSLCSTMARISSTVPPRPRKLLLMQKS